MDERSPVSYFQVNKNGAREEGDVCVCDDDEAPVSWRQVTDALNTTWDFHPYPRCSLNQLEQIHTYHVATISKAVAYTAEVKLFDVEIVGVIGIVWVSLSGCARPFPGSTVAAARGAGGSSSSQLSLVEGYLNVVLVAPEHRRRGIGRTLLSHCLSMRETRAVRKSKPGPAEPRVIARWRLHTMTASLSTRDYIVAYHRAVAAEECDAAKEAKTSTSGEASFSEQGMHLRCIAMTAEAQADEDMDRVKSVQQLYSLLGFEVRRDLYNYYEKRADAVEMVLTVSAARKGTRA